MMIRSASTFINTFLLLEMGYAMTWPGPTATPAGLMAINGVSPRPTQAPGFNGVPGELRERAAGQYLYPPPPNWCGFINGEYDNVLSCASDYTCTSSGAAFGCCTGPAEQCGNIFTSCVDSVYFSDSCDTDCIADPQVNKCTDSSMPWCGTFSFYGGNYLYNCDSTIAGMYTVESLADWYGALGSTLTNGADSSSESTEESSTTSTSTTATSTREGRSSESSVTSNVRSTSASSFPVTTSTRPIPSAPAHRGLSGAAIGGIAVGGAAVILAIAAGIVAACCYRRRRRRNRQAAAANAPISRPPAIFDHTQGLQQQAMAQPEKTYSAFKPSYLNPQSPPAYAGPPSPIQPYDPNQGYSHRASTVSTAVSPHPLHFEEMPKVSSPETAGGYFSPPPAGGLSELSESDGAMMPKDPSTGLPMQLRVGSPQSQVYSAVREMPATTPEPQRWELPSKP